MIFLMLRTVLWVVLGVGCTNPVTPNGCELEPGVYRVDFFERSGTCGPIAGVDVLFEEGEGVGPPAPGADPACTGSVDFTDDFCSVEIDRVCPVYDADGTLLGTFEWRGVSSIISSTRVEGSFAHLSDGPGVEVDCSSVYDIWWTHR